MTTATAQTGQPAPSANPQEQEAGVFKIRKTCEPLAVAQDVKERVLDSAVNMGMKHFENTIKAPGFELPMLPSLAMKLMQLLDDPDASVRTVAEQITNDPVMAAKLLTLANSAFYGGQVKTINVQQAVTRLGLSTVKSLVMSIALHGMVFRDARLAHSAKTFFEHSIQCAAAAQDLAMKIEAPGAAAFMAGLLHDIGKVPALIFVQHSMGTQQGFRQVFIDGIVERHHVHAGMALLSVWDIPVEARVAILAHHSVNSVNDAMEQTKLLLPNAKDSERERLALTLCTVVLADRALASIGFAEERGEVDIMGCQICQDLGISDTEIVDFLQGLPERLAALPQLGEK